MEPTGEAIQGELAKRMDAATGARQDEPAQSARPVPDVRATVARFGMTPDRAGYKGSFVRKQGDWTIGARWDGETNGWIVHGEKAHKPIYGACAVEDRVDETADSGRLAQTLEAVFDRAGIGYEPVLRGVIRDSDGQPFAPESRQSRPISPADEPAKKRPEADRSPTPAQEKAANRLRAQADTLDARANEALGADRNTNTVRRAKKAASAVGNALSDQAMAKTMRAIADAIEAGETKYLQNISTRAHIEELNGQARLAMSRFNRQTNEKYDENRKPSAKHADFAKIPEIKVDDSYYKNLILEELKGKRGIGANTRNKIDRGHRLTTEEADLIVSLSKTAERYMGNSLGAKKRLAKIGVLSDDDLRAAIAEYLDRKQSKAKEDPIKRMERELVGKNFGIDFFPTPPALADRVVREAEIEEGMSVLEPSAGKGDLLDAVRRARPDAKIEAVEPSGPLRELLDAKGYALVGSDFEKHDGRYDRIVMNPPFSDSTDIRHVRRAYDMLNHGGRLVAIMGEGAFFRNDKQAADFREWLDSVGGSSEKLPDGSFKSSFRPTGVAARLVVIDKRESGETRQSSPSSTPKPATVAQARAQLASALGERDVTALERSGRLVWHATDPTKIGAAGFVDGAAGVIHLIPGNMDQDALSVALHEGMHLARDDRFAEGERAKVRLAHATLKLVGLKNFVGNPGFSDVVQQVYRMAAEGNKVAVEALTKARLEAKANPRADVAEEAVAYLAQYADERLPLVRRVLAEIRAALYRMGVKVKLTPADVRALALSALKARAKAAGRAMAAREREAKAFSLPDFAPTEADKAEVERQMRAVKEVRDDKSRLLAPNGEPSNLNERQWKQVRTQFFKDWFGEWESIARRDALDAMPAIRLDDADLARLEGKALRDEVSRRYAEMKSEPVVTVDGRIVRFTRVGIREIKQHSADRTVLDLLAKANQTLKRAIPLWSLDHLPKGVGDSVRAWHYYGAKVSLQGKEFFARLVLREDVNGTIYYDNDLSSAEEISGRAVDASRSKTGAAAVSADGHTLGAWYRSVNGANASKVVDENGEPKVVYHGTSSALSEFDPKMRGGVTGAPSSKKGFFFASVARVADTYATAENPTRPERVKVGRLQAKRRALDSRMFRHLMANISPAIRRKYYSEEADERAALSAVAKKKVAAINDQFIADHRSEFEETSDEAIFAATRAADAAFSPNVVPVFLNIRNPAIHDFLGSHYREISFNDVIERGIEDGNDGAILKDTFDSNALISVDKTDVLVAFHPDQIKSAIGNAGTFSPRSGRIDYSQPDERDLSDAQRFDHAVAALRPLAGNPDSFKYAKSSEKDLAAIARDLDPRLKVSPPAATRQNPLRANRRFGRSWTVTMPDGETADVLDSPSGREVHIDASGLEEGSSRGSLLYQLVGQWAANNGKVFVGDPEGISPAGKARRLEHLISLALKFGTTDHFMPHPDQNIPWKVGEHGYNLAQMLMASGKMIGDAVPDLKAVRYDFDGKRFINSDTGREVGDADFATLADSRGARAAHAGDTTLKRSVLVSSLVRAAGRKGWRDILGAAARLGAPDLQGRPLDPALKRLFYSRPTDEADAAEQARLWAEFQAVRARFQAKDAMKTPFRRWFGDGTEGVTARDGKPLTLYHGTNSPEFNRWDAGRAGQATTHPTAGLGFFMTADKRSAARYGKRLLALHAKIDRPYHLTDADLWAIDSVAEATRFRRKLMAQGYDGAVIAAPGAASYVIAFESRQVKHTTNESPTESEDFRYSMPTASLRERIEALDPVSSPMRCRSLKRANRRWRKRNACC